MLVNALFKSLQTLVKDFSKWIVTSWSVLISVFQSWQFWLSYLDFTLRSEVLKIDKKHFKRGGIIMDTSFLLHRNRVGLLSLNVVFWVDCLVFFLLDWPSKPQRKRILSFQLRGTFNRTFHCFFFHFIWKKKYLGGLTVHASSTADQFMFNTFNFVIS